MPPRPENVEPLRLTYRLEDGLIRLSAGSPRPGSSRLREAPVAQRGRRGAGWGAELGAEGRPGVRGSEPREVAGVRGRSQEAGISVGPAPPRPRGGVMSAAGLLAPAPAPAAAPAAPEYYPEDDEELESAEDDERSCRGRESDEGAGGGIGAPVRVVRGHQSSWEPGVPSPASLISSLGSERCSPWLPHSQLLSSQCP